MDEVEIEPLKRYLAPSIIEWLLDEENSTSTFVDNGMNVDEFLTGVGSMGAPGAGAPMKFLSGTHTYKVTLCLELFSCYRFSVHIGGGIRAPIY